MQRVILILLLAIPILAGGAMAAEPRNASIPVGSSLVLNQPLTIAAYGLAANIQGGKVVPDKVRDQYHPWCRLELRQTSETPRTLEPGRFAIVRVKQGYDYVLRERAQLAALRSAGLMSVYNYYVELFLESEAQPQVYRMTCQNWETGPDDQYLTIGEIRVTLGELFTLELKQ